MNINLMKLLTETKRELNEEIFELILEFIKRKLKTNLLINNDAITISSEYHETNDKIIFNIDGTRISKMNLTPILTQLGFEKIQEDRKTIPGYSDLGVTILLLKFDSEKLN